MAFFHPPTMHRFKVVLWVDPVPDLNSLEEDFSEKVVMKHFTKFPGKQLQWSFFLSNINKKTFCEFVKSRVILQKTCVRLPLTTQWFHWDKKTSNGKQCTSFTKDLLPESPLNYISTRTCNRLLCICITKLTLGPSDCIDVLMENKVKSNEFTLLWRHPFIYCSLKSWKLEKIALVST